VSISKAGKSTYAGSLSPEFALLGLLSRGGAHGYELHQKLTADLGQVWHVSLSQTYNILNRLEENGYIEGELQAQAKLPARRIFRLTLAGRERFVDWLRTPSRSSVRAIRVEFTTRLYFARAHDLALAQALVQKQIDETRAGLERIKAQLAEIPEEQAFNRLGLDLRVRQLGSILSWLENCFAVIGGPGSGAGS
jgi:DNA-binding PadR family transcriptional regulator